MSKRPLTKERILKAAIRIADKEGLTGLSMRRLAAALGVEAMSLYHHLASKEALLDAIYQALIEEADLPTGTVAWEDWVRRTAAGFRRVGAAHPGSFALFAQRAANGAMTLRPFEAGLDAFRRAGLAPEAAYSSLSAVAGVVVGLALQDAIAAGAAPTRTNIEDLDMTEFPRINEVAPFASQTEPDVLWQFMIDTLVAGLRAQLAHPRLL
jgi:AcrR family transcriptional regulator